MSINLLANPLILGATGNVGCQLMKLLPHATGVGREQSDVTKPVELEALLNKQPWSVIINCIAYNNVDGAETDSASAIILNTTLPGILTTWAAKHNVPLVHISTGYVFDGEQESYTESDAPHPVSVYGQTKADGEQLVLAHPQNYVIRTNLLFGPKGVSDNSKPSVVDVMLNAGRKNGALKGITDEHSSFCYTPDLTASLLALLADNGTPGIYHLVNSGSGSWFELAQEIFAITGDTVELTPITGADYPRAAKRPTHAVLNNTKRPQLRPWQEALREYLKGVS
jgi:dTDP-4-dehydrorhamnose reductase